MRTSSVIDHARSVYAGRPASFPPRARVFPVRRSIPSLIVGEETFLSAARDWTAGRDEGWKHERQNEAECRGCSIRRPSPSFAERGAGRGRTGEGGDTHSERGAVCYNPRVQSRDPPPRVCIDARDKGSEKKTERRGGWPFRSGWYPLAMLTWMRTGPRGGFFSIFFFSRFPFSFRSRLCLCVCVFF